MPHSILGFPLQWNWHIPLKNEWNVKWNRVQFVVVYVVELLNTSYTCSKPYIIQIEQTKCISNKMENNLMLNVSTTIP
jgi:hypothetical protein